MFDMFSQPEAAITKSNILAVYAFIDSLITIYFPKLTAITVVVVLFASYLFGDYLLLYLILFLFDLSHDFGWFFIPTKWTLYDSIVLDLVFGPLQKTL